MAAAPTAKPPTRMGQAMLAAKKYLVGAMVYGSEEFEDFLDWMYQHPDFEEAPNEIEFPEGSNCIWQRSVTRKLGLYQVTFVGRYNESGDEIVPPLITIKIIQQNPDKVNERGELTPGAQLVADGHDVAQVILEPRGVKQGMFIGNIVDGLFDFYKGHDIV